MLNDHRVVRTGPVQHPAVRRTSLSQIILVIAGAAHPLSRLELLPLDKLAQPPAELLLVGALSQLHLEQGVGAGHKVAVGVQKRGHQAPSLQVHLPGLRACQLQGMLQLAHIADDAVLFHQGLGIQRLLHGQDGTAEIDALCHIHTSFSPSLG